MGGCVGGDGEGLGEAEERLGGRYAGAEVSVCGLGEGRREWDRRMKVRDRRRGEEEDVHLVELVDRGAELLLQVADATPVRLNAHQRGIAQDRIVQENRPLCSNVSILLCSPPFPFHAPLRREVAVAG